MQEHKDLVSLSTRSALSFQDKGCCKRDVWPAKVTGFYDRVFSTLCPRLVGELCKSSLTCMAASPSLPFWTLCWSCVQPLGQRSYFGCTRHFVMHVCMIQGCVCFMSVQGVKHIHIYIYLILHDYSDYTMFWGTHTNCKSSAVPQWLWMYIVLFPRERQEKI